MTKPHFKINRILIFRNTVLVASLKLRPLALNPRRRNEPLRNEVQRYVICPFIYSLAYLCVKIKTFYFDSIYRDSVHSCNTVSTMGPWSSRQRAFNSDDLSSNPVEPTLFL